MNTVPAALTSRRLLKLLPWISGLVLAAGVAAVLLVFFRNTGKSLETPVRNEPAQISTTPKSVPLTREERRVAGRFILTAVARKNLAESYGLVTAHMKQGLTLKQWLTGNIPVVPFAVGDKTVASINVVHSYRRDATLQVALLPPKGSKVKGSLFYLGLKKVGRGTKARWLVDSWIPYASVPIPRDNS